MSNLDITNYPEHIRDAVDKARTRKEDLVGDTTIEENDDLIPSVELYRDDTLIAGVLPRHVDRDLALTAASMAVPGFNADACVLTLDAHITRNVTKNDAGETVWSAGPRKGQTIKEHEMQNMCDEEGACDLGLITDCLVVLRVTRDGVREQATLPYHVHKADRTVVWADVDDASRWMSSTDSEVRLEGVVPDTVASFFERTPMIDVEKTIEIPPAERDEVRSKLAAAGFTGDLLDDDGLLHMPKFAEFGLGRDVAQYHIDCATTKALVLQEFSVFLNPENDTKQQIISESFAGLSPGGEPAVVGPDA